MSSLVFSRDDLQPNPNAKKNAADLVGDYLFTPVGILQTSRLAQRTVKFVNESRNVLGAGYDPTLSDLDSKFFMGWAMLAVPGGLYKMTRDSMQSIKDLKTSSLTPEHATRKIEKAVNKICETSALFGHAAGLLGRTKIFSPAANTLDFIADTVDFKMAVTDLNRTQTIAQKAVQAKADSEVLKNINHSKKHIMIRIAKAVCSVVAGFFGFALLAFGGPIVPALILITLALAGTILTIAGHFYKETRPYTLIDTYQEKYTPLFIPSASLA